MHRRITDEQTGTGAGGQAVQSREAALLAASLAEKRLRAAIEALPEGIVFLDEEDRYILWNEKYAEIYAKSADLLEPGVRLADTLSVGVQRGDYPEAVGREEEWLAHRMALLRQPGIRHEQWLSNGRCIMIEERKVEGCGTIGIRVDITELKQREETFRLLFERNPQAMLVYDLRSGLVRSANEAACTFFGYEPEEMEGLAAQALFPADNRDKALNMLASDCSDTSDCWQMLRRDGSSVEADRKMRAHRLGRYVRDLPIIAKLAATVPALRHLSGRSFFFPI